MQADTRMHASFFSSNLVYEQILVYEDYSRARNNWSLVFCCMCTLSWESVLGKVPRRRHERGQHLLVFGCVLSTVSVLFNRDHSLTARIAAAPVAASTCSSRGFNAFLGGGTPPRVPVPGTVLVCTALVGTEPWSPRTAGTLDHDLLNLTCSAGAEKGRAFPKTASSHSHTHNG